MLLRGGLVQQNSGWLRPLGLSSAEFASVRQLGLDLPNERLVRPKSGLYRWNVRLVRRIVIWFGSKVQTKLGLVRPTFALARQHDARLGKQTWPHSRSIRQGQGWFDRICVGSATGTEG